MNRTGSLLDVEVFNWILIWKERTTYTRLDLILHQWFTRLVAFIQQVTSNAAAFWPVASLNQRKPAFLGCLVTFMRIFCFLPLANFWFSWLSESHYSLDISSPTSPFIFPVHHKPSFHLAFFILFEGWVLDGESGSSHSWFLAAMLTGQPLSRCKARAQFPHILDNFQRSIEFRDEK